MNKSLRCLLLAGCFVAVSVQAQPRTAAEMAKGVAQIEAQLEAMRLGPASVQALQVRQSIGQTWTGEDWENASRNTFEYEGENQIVSLYETWTGTDWQNASRTLSTYDDGLVSTIVYQTWDGTDWVDDSRDLYTYTGGEIVELLSQIYDGGAWVNSERTIPYDGSNILEGSETQVWDGSDWQPFSQDRFSQEGDDLHYVNAEWSEGAGAYVDTLRTIYSDLSLEEFYAILDEVEVNPDLGFFGATLLFFQFPDFIIQEWTGTEWMNVTRLTSETDDEGRRAEVLLEDWNGTDWEPNSRYIATHDAEGRLEVLEVQTFDEDWVTFMLVTNEYDAEGLLSRAVYQADMGTGLENFYQILFEWTDTGTAAENPEIPTSIELEPLYPNPFNPTTTVRYTLDGASHARVNVYDVTGRHVRTLVDAVQPAGAYEIVFDAAGLPSGMYLVRLETPKLMVARTVTLLR